MIMKKLHFGFILLLVFVSFISCESNINEDNSSFTKQLKEEYDLKPDELPFYVKAYIEEHSKLFGDDVVVFDSWEDLDRELNALQHMTYTEHRVWLNSRLLNSPILNSLIIHDSVQTAIWKEYGLDYDDVPFDQSNLDKIEEFLKDEDYQKLEDRAFEKYDIVMSEKFSEYVKEEKDSMGSIWLSPLGVLNEQVFCNTKNLYICEGMVIKYLGDGILSCPIDEYEKYDKVKSIIEVDISGSSHRVIVEPYANNDKTFTSADGEPYKTSVNFHISVTKGWFGLERKKTSMCAINYHRNEDGSYRRVGCLTNIVADVGVECHSGKWDYNFRTGWWFMKGGITYFRINYVNCGCPYTRFSYINLDLHNQHGVTIKENVKF